MSKDIEKGEEAGEFLQETLPAPTAGASASHAVSSEDGGREGAVQQILRQSAHPKAAIFHVAFKIGAIVSYLLLGLFTQNFVVQFVVTVTLLAFDFWTVKNVTGRLLVGLRWWHEVAEDGTTQTWRFETIPDRAALNLMDSRIFWWTLYATPAIWLVLGIVCVLKFNISYLVIVLIAIVLSAANIVGYYKCNKDATEQMRNYIGKTVLGHAMERSGLGALGRFVS